MSKKKRYMVTTVDNPYDPFDQFDDWYMFDTDKGYGTCSYLARVAHTSDQLSEEENALEVEHAIDDMIRYDFMNQYLKVSCLE